MQSQYTLQSQLPLIAWVWKARSGGHRCTLKNKKNVLPGKLLFCLKEKKKVFSNRCGIANQKILLQLYIIELKSTLWSSGSNNNDICFVVRKVTFILVASNLISGFETFCATSPFSILLFRAYHILISLPNTFLEKEVLSPGKK